MWDAPNDPQIYGQLRLDARPIVAFVEAARAHGHHVTPTHLVGRAVAHVLDRHPDLDVRIVGGRAYPRPSVEVFFITAVGGGHDLSGVKVARASRKSVYEIAAEVERRARALKAGDDPGFAKSKRLTDTLPPSVLRVALRAITWVTTTHGVPLPALGLEASPFGGAMITSVGMFGLPAGFAPLARLYGVPMVVAVGEIADEPVAEGGRVVVRPMLPIAATLDHRYLDGWHVGQVMATFREYLAAPARFEPDLARQEDVDADRPSVAPPGRVS